VKERLRVQVANCVDTMTELYNETTDVLFLTELWVVGEQIEGAKTLFWISLVFLAMHMLGRVWVVWQMRGDVDGGERGAFARSALLYMVEPNSGMRGMKETLKDTARGGMIFDVAKGEYVTVDMDAIAVQAHNDWVAGVTEVRTILLLMLTEDVPEFIIQLIFLFHITDKAPPTLFWLTTVGTLLHMLRQAMDAWTTWSQLPRLERKANGRDKAFEKFTTTDATVHEFAAKHGDEVRSANMKGCCNLTDIAVMALAEACAELQTVTLTDCPSVTDASVIKLAKGCPRLQTVWLNRCVKIMDASLIELGKGCPHLQTLSLNGCFNIKDAGVIDLAKGCSQLQTIYLNACAEITDASVVALGQGCPQLKQVYLACCNKITDAGVTKLCEGCPRLHTVSLYQCPEITDVGVIELGKGCPQLHTVWLNSCTKVTDNGVIELGNHCSQLQTVHFSLLMLRDHERRCDWAYEKLPTATQAFARGLLQDHGCGAGRSASNMSSLRVSSLSTRPLSPIARPPGPMLRLRDELATTALMLGMCISTAPRRRAPCA
jgi:hypothetical protein